MLPLHPYLRAEISNSMTRDALERAASHRRASAAARGRSPSRPNVLIRGAQLVAGAIGRLLRRPAPLTPQHPLVELAEPDAD